MKNNSESEDYDIDATGEVLEKLHQISEEYELEDLTLEGEKEVLEEVAGAIRTFHDVSQQLHDARDQNYEEDVKLDAYSLGVRTGQMWPEAYRAKETMQDVAESGEITEKVLYSALNNLEDQKYPDTAPGINSSRQEDTVDRAVDVLTDMDELSQLYAEAEANARTASQFMLIDGEDGNPIDIVTEVAENGGYDEFVEYVDEIRNGFHETEEEMNQEIMEIADQVID